MGHKKSYFKKPSRALKLALQAARLKQAFPDSKLRFDRNVSLVWTGHLQPSPLSNVYTVKIRYRPKDRPEVAIVAPELISMEEDRTPHVFTNKRLCLFRYKYHEWDSTMHIADTIVPWTSLWLFHYEIWLATGKWCGANEEHPNKDEGKELSG